MTATFTDEERDQLISFLRKESGECGQLIALISKESGNPKPSSNNADMQDVIPYIHR